MSNTFPYRVFALTMAFLMFFTSIGFSMDMHFCQGNLKNINLFGKAKSCFEMESEGIVSSCSKHQSTCHQKSTAEDHKGCCNNETVEIQLDTDFLDTTIGSLNIQQLHFVVAYLYTYFGLLTEQFSSEKFLHYKPPLPDKDLLVFIQSFLL